MKTVSLKVYYVTIKFEEQFELYILSMQKNNNTVKIGWQVTFAPEPV